MKVLLLANGGSSHIQKWIRSLSEKGLDIGLFSLNHFEESIYSGCKNLSILNNPSYKNSRSVFTKINYLTNNGLLKKQIQLYKPDILHAHYATSYGMLGAKSNFKPYVVSVWGSDVYDFPKKSPLHKNIVKRVLAKATVICSTSNCMKLETGKYTHSAMEIIPFGVDTSVFTPVDGFTLDKKEITVGIIKSLEKKYGIDFLIRAFKNVVGEHPKKILKLKIIGEGSKKEEYKKLCEELHIAEKVEFVGKVSHDEVIKYHQLIDIFVCLSTLDSESFGVSLVEAMACGKPVVASDVAGFKEVIDSDANGILVPKNSYKEAAEAINFYINNPDLALKKGANARLHVLQKYSWNSNVEQMLNVYKKLI